jgi:hypothetical protein
MSFYSDMAAVANDLLAEFGQTITLRRTTPGTFDKTAETETGETTAEITATGIQKNYAQGLIDGSRILSSDKLIILDDDQVPVMTDKIKVGAVYWNIVDIKPVEPAGVPLVYFVQARK